MSNRLLLVYGLLNAVLYACLLPLWEGFDEEFHYGYVEYIRLHHRIPVLGRTGMPLEIGRSAALLPMSRVMIDNLRATGIRTFAEYFALTSADRHDLHDQAWRVVQGMDAEEVGIVGPNYEVHHAPLAYVLLAIPDWLVRGASLPARVRALRILSAVSSMLLTLWGLKALAAAAGLKDSMASLLIFLMFSSQMYWATVAHVANDWLAVPLAVWLFALAMKLDRRGARAAETREVVTFAIVFGLGLLSKAYFLVFAPLYVLAAVVWWRRGVLTNWTVQTMLVIPVVLGGFWYGRNFGLYQNITGRLEESSGVNTGSVLLSLPSIPWGNSIPFMGRGAFWLGNGSFTDFSVRTIDAMLVLVGLGLLLCLWARRDRSDAILWMPLLLFCAAMIYVAGSSFTYTKGLATVASPWYLQAVMPSLFCLALLGAQAKATIGKWVAATMALVWGYVMAATYIAKLFPLYGGFAEGRSTLRAIVHWYASDWPRTADILDTTALAPHLVLVLLLFGVVVTMLVLLPLLVRRIWNEL